MWNRRKEEEAPRTGSPLSGSPLPGPVAPMEGMPVSTTPTGYQAARNTATIGENVLIAGQIFAKEDLVIDGQIDGTIELLEHKVTIGKAARVKATVKAREVVIHGTVHGNVEASDKIDLRRDAHLVGDIRAARIAIEDGAIFKGSIDVTKVEVPKAAPRPATSAAPTQTPVAATNSQQAMAAGAGEQKR
ncbi:MAG: polymer-forming cytoskeletal protein [Bryobacteraceae bacterium]|nr:polymer-forming cytoskeletal protein [Bryobacteraceae bacterium]